MYARHTLTVVRARVLGKELSLRHRLSRHAQWSIQGLLEAEFPVVLVEATYMCHRGNRLSAYTCFQPSVVRQQTQGANVGLVV